MADESDDGDDSDNKECSHKPWAPARRVVTSQGQSEKSLCRRMTVAPQVARTVLQWRRLLQSLSWGSVINRTRAHPPLSSLGPGSACTASVYPRPSSSCEVESVLWSTLASFSLLNRASMGMGTDGEGWRPGTRYKIHHPTACRTVQATIAGGSHALGVHMVKWTGPVARAERSIRSY